MKPLLPTLALLAATGCVADAPNGPEAGVAARDGRDCFNVQFVSGYSSVDRDTVRLDAGPRQRYDVDIQGPLCDQIDWTQRIALESTPSSWICVGSQAGQGEVHFRDPATRRRTSCYIQEVRRVAEEPRAR